MLRSRPSAVAVSDHARIDEEPPRRTPYSRDVILERANAFSVEHYGVGVSDRQLERWVYRGLIPGPEPHGRQRGLSPLWVWTPLSYRRLLQVCRLRSRGVTDVSAIALRLWFAGAAYPFSTVRGAAISEFRRLRRAVAQPIPASWDPRRSGAELPPRSREAVLRGLGADDPLWLALSPEALLRLGEAMFFGTEPSQDAMLMLLSNAGVRGILTMEPSGQDVGADEIRLAKQIFAGLVADPENTDKSAEAALESADEETFANIKDFAQVAPCLYSTMPAVVSALWDRSGDPGAALNESLAKTCKTLRHPPFRLLHFVFLVRRAQIKGDHGRGVGVLARKVIRPLRQLVRFVGSDKPTKTLIGEALALLGVGPVAPFSVVVSLLAAKQTDPTLQRVARSLIKITWRHGTAELLKLRKLASPQ